MRKNLFCGPILLGLAVILFSWGIEHAGAKTAPSASLFGRVSSPEEGPMEGVLVSAKKEGSTVTITVVSDAQGRYSFPRMKLDAGRYALHIRAVGYDLDDPGPVELTAQKTVQMDLKLRKAQDLARQLHLDRFEEIIAVGALYRPGPMDMIPSFINRKHGRDPIEYDHPWMEEIL